MLLMGQFQICSTVIAASTGYSESAYVPGHSVLGDVQSATSAPVPSVPSQSRLRRMRAKQVRDRLWLAAKMTSTPIDVRDNQLDEDDAGAARDDTQSTPAVEDKLSAIMDRGNVDFRAEVETMRSVLSSEEERRAARSEACATVKAEVTSLHESVMQMKRFRERNDVRPYMQHDDLFRRIVAKSAAAVGKSSKLNPELPNLQEAWDEIRALREGIRADWKELKAAPPEAEAPPQERRPLEIAGITKRGMPQPTKSKKKRK